ncbi:hypothetical protein BY996DRAFT_268670 [Phakopsora pachyrhizi]|nr:hypothetical protein BY996DRAFT_268670 [Phakopsora pachyrhizi]
MILLKEKIPVLIKMIEAQVHIIPDNVQGMYIGDVIQALLKIDLHKSEIHSDFIVKASITFQLYAVYILKEANLELDNLRTSLLIDLMRIFCAIFGHEGTLKLTESNKILTLLAKGFHSIIEDLFDRGEIKNLWKLESYKTLCAYSQAHPLTFIFRNIYRFGNKNTWDSLLNEYMTLEFKSLNNREINNLLEDILPLSKLSCKPEEEKKKIVNTLLHNLLNVKSLPPLSEIQNTPGKVRVYFSLRWLSKYLMEENELSVEDNPHNQNYKIFRYLRGFILIYSNEKNIINLKNSFGFDKIAKYFLSKHARIETGTKPKASIYKLHEDYNAYLQKYRRYLDTYFFA